MRKFFLVLCALFLLCVIATAQHPSTRIALSADSDVSMADIQRGFDKSCPGVSLTLNRDKADFVLSAVMNPRLIDGTEYRGKSGYALFNSNGDLVFTTRTRYQKNAIKDVCQFIRARGR